MDYTSYYLFYLIFRLNTILLSTLRTNRSDFSFLTMEENQENINPNINIDMTGAIEPMVTEVVQKLSVENEKGMNTLSESLNSTLKEGFKELGNILFQFGASNFLQTPHPNGGNYH